MSNTDDLDDVFGPLRSSATTSELANEAATVDAMAHAHNASKGRITMLNSRKARVATLIAAGIIGFGGVAAAGPGGFQSLELPDEEPVETTIATTVPAGPEETEEPETSTPTTEAPETSVVTTTEAPSIQDPQKEEADVPVASFEDDPDTDFNEETCLEGNHGKTVSAVARGEYEGENTDGSEVEVRDAAHSTCGKKSDADHDEESKEAAESEHEDDDSDHDDDEGDDDSDDDDADDSDDDDDDDETVEKPAKKSGNSASKDKGGHGRGKNKKGD